MWTPRLDRSFVYALCDLCITKDLWGDVNFIEATILTFRVSRHLYRSNMLGRLAICLGDIRAQIAFTIRPSPP